jgi:hypothetical protein
MWGSFAGRVVADVSKKIQAVEELLMILEDERTDFVRNVGMALHPNKPDFCKTRGVTCG